MNNVFEWDGLTHLVLIDTNGTVSGNYMKEIQKVRPRVIEKLKNIAKNKEVAVGQPVKISNYVFLAVKNSYRNKLEEKKLEEILKNVPEQYKLIDYKTNEEDSLINVLQRHFKVIKK